MAGVVCDAAIKRKRFTRDRCVALIDLHPLYFSNRIKVKLLRSFPSGDLFNDTQELILADEHGQKIHAVVDKATANRYAKTLVEGNWLSITNFDLYPVVDGQLRLTSHSFTIHWKPSTLARKLKSLGSGDYFDFVSFERAKSGLLDHNLCIDLVGRVMNVSIFDEDQQEGSNWDQLYFELENARGVRMQCRLPKEYSDEFFAGWKTCVDNIIMCILRFARLETSLGNVRAMTANMCTRIMFNHPCVEVQELRQFFVDQEKQ